VEQRNLLSTAIEDGNVALANDFDGNGDESVDSADDQLDDPGPVQGRQLPPGVTMLESGAARAFVRFRKISLFVGDYYRIEDALTACTIAEARILYGPKMKKAGTLQRFVYKEVKRRGIARCGE
jgi:hypothetical protein